jgi:hypothetical protein
MTERKHFTVQEANHALPALRKVMALLQDRMKWLATNKPVITYLIREFRIPQDTPVPADYFRALVQVKDALGEVETLGCQLKDIQRGLVDFPSRLFGKEVLLCWRLGEENVGFYHDLESGYAGRQPIPERGEGGDAGSGEGEH